MILRERANCRSIVSGTLKDAGFMPNRHETVTNPILVESYLIRAFEHNVEVVFFRFTRVCFTAAGEITSHWLFFYFVGGVVL